MIASSGYITVYQREDYKIETIAKDSSSYNIQVLGITETHIREEVTKTVNVESGKYIFYNGGINGENVYSGVGILIEENLVSRFKRITDRICTCEIDLDEENRKIFSIVAYAPTLVK